MSGNELYLHQDILYEDYIDIVDDIFVSIDLAYNVTDCNLAYCRLRNESRKEIIGTQVLDTVQEKELDKFINILDNRTKGTKLKDKNFEIVNLIDFNKKFHPFKLTVYIIVNSDGIKTGLFLVFKKFVERTEETTYFTTLKAIFNSLSDTYAIITTAADNKIKSINSFVEKSLGYKDSDVLNIHISELFEKSTANKSSLKKIIEEIKVKGKASTELNLVSKKGETVPMFVNFSTLVGKDGIIGTIAVLRDLREEKELVKNNENLIINIQNQSKLSELSDIIQGFAQNVNIPLTGIKSSSQLLESKIKKIKAELTKEGALSGKVEKMFDGLAKSNKMVIDSCQRQEKVIGLLLNKSRKEKSKKSEHLDLCQVFEAELEFLMLNEFFKLNIEKDFDFERNLPKIYGLYSDFSQVFYNLVQNALDAMTKSDRKLLGVKVFSDKEFINISVSDTGHGITPENRKKVFKPFFTTKADFSKAKENEPVGNGFGLYIAQMILEQYKGSINFESVVGVGTEFIIKIPIEDNQKKK